MPRSGSGRPDGRSGASRARGGETTYKIDALIAPTAADLTGEDEEAVGPATGKFGKARLFPSAGRLDGSAIDVGCTCDGAAVPSQGGDKSGIGT